MSYALQNKSDTEKALKAFHLLRDFSESELETLEILSDPGQKEVILKSLKESGKGAVHPVRSLLK